MTERTKDLKRRVRRLEEAVAALSDKSVLMKVETAQEYETLLMIAANHNMRISEYVRSCVIKYSNEFLAAKEEEAKIKAEESKDEPVEDEVSEDASETAEDSDS